MWHLEEFNNNLAVITEEGDHYTYSQLMDLCNQLITNIAKRCLVFSFCSNSLESLVGYIGFINNRIVPLLLSKNIDHELVENLIYLYKPDYLYIPNDLLRKFDKYTIRYSIHDYTLLKTDYETAYPLHDDLALLLTTSGSTGSPKFVRQSYKNIQSNITSIIECLDINTTERAITTLPMNYTYGLSIINTHLYAGASFILTEKAVTQKEFWLQLKKHEATSFGGVPYTYEILDRLRFSRMELPSLKYMTQAGGKLSPKLHKKFAQYAAEQNIKFVVMYGQTEATARMAYLPSIKSVEKCGSIGGAIPGGSFSLVDIDGNITMTPCTRGELVYSGDNVTLGYAEKGEDLILGDKREGTLATGDLAIMDEDGFFFIVGRKSRFIKIHGNRISLDDIEHLIKAGFHGIDCGCTGVDNKMLVFVTSPEIKVDVTAFITKKTGIHRIGFKVFVIDEISKNDAGKTLYKELIRKVD